MKLKCLFVFLMVGLMVSYVFAAGVGFYWDGSNSNWDDDDGTSNWIDQTAAVATEPDGSKEMQAFGGTDAANPLGGTITLNSVESWGGIGSNRCRFHGPIVLNIVSGGLSGPGWLRVGEYQAKGAGRM